MQTTNNKRKWVNDELIALVIVVAGLMMIMLAFNYKTIRLSLKGYSPTEINMILEMDETKQAQYF